MDKLKEVFSDKILEIEEDICEITAILPQSASSFSR
jgi:hypothetical protein